MELSIYSIIKSVVTSPDSPSAGKQNKVVFEVNDLANKVMIRSAVERIWGVKVKKVNVLRIKGKKRSFARKVFFSSCRKRAFVSLAEGEKIDLSRHVESDGKKVVV